MFLHLSVILFTECVYQTPPGQTPPVGRHPPPRQTSPAQCMLGYSQQAGGTQSTGRHSSCSCFQMIPLRNGCAEFMMQHVTMSNCIGIYFFAKAHHCEPLANKANEIIHRNFQVKEHKTEFLSCETTLRPRSNSVIR